MITNTRLSFKLFLLVILLTVVYFVVDYKQSLTRYENHINIEIHNKVKALGEVVTRTISIVSSVSATLTQSQISDKELAILSQEFRVLMRTNPDFMQIRFLSANGMERLRLQNNEQGIVAVPADQLQDKSQHDYFKKTITLPKRSIYISKLDLNVEHGEIEVPFKPTYRIAAPVRDENGLLVGVFIINLNMRVVLDRLTHPSSGVKYFLLDAEGHLLAGGNKAEQFQHLINSNANYADKKPELWTAVNGVHFKTFKLENKQYQSEMLSPVALYEGEGKYFPLLLAAGDTRYYFISEASPSRLLAHIYERTGLVFIFLFFTYLFGLRVWEIRQKLEQKRQQDTLHAQRLGRLLHYSDELVMLTDKRGYIEYVNRAFCETSGYREHEVLNKRPSITSSGYHDDAFYKRLWETLQRGEAFRALFVNRRRDGSLYYEQKTIRPEMDTDGQIIGYLSIGKDLSDTETLRRAYLDDLTGLHNRAMLMEKLNYLSLSTKRTTMHLAIFYLDLDGFKAINDQYGHEVGDKILIQATEKLHSLFRDTDTLVRLGGDEFVVVTENMSRSDAQLCAEKTLLNMNQGWSLENKDVSGLSASVGVALVTADRPFEPSLLIEKADAAMYKAKHNGKNQVYIDDVVLSGDDSL